MYSVLRLELLAHQTNTEQAALPLGSCESGKAYIGGCPQKCGSVY